ncbi:hypothetical protein CARUB_v10028488mg [Capsella rubella]|uniref:Uncharacterized protein n=1 Tax=Capsella rubella TaxID=81985 RepID=R0G897_9BRAS|nr:hypothetical protein CARUB_v10028488mg [Capsella rubella]
MQIHVETVNEIGAAMYSGVAGTVSQILKEEGLVGFTRGMGPRVLHSACFSAIGYFAFETARLTVLNEYLKRKEDSETKLDAFFCVWLCYCQMNKERDRAFPKKHYSLTLLGCFRDQIILKT